MKMDKKYLLLKGFTLIVFVMLTFLFCNLKAYAIEDTTWQNDYDFGVYETYDSFAQKRACNSSDVLSGNCLCAEYQRSG